MKTNTLLIVGGVGLVAFLVLKKRATTQQQIAAANLANSNGGRPQPGVGYATPTAVAGVVAGAVNGILNWISGTPDSSSSAVISENPVDSGMGFDLDGWATNLFGSTSILGGGNDGSVSGTNPQNGSQLDIWSNMGDWGFQ